MKRFILAVIAGIALFVPAARAEAQFSVPFGGRILASIPCTCDQPGTLILTVGPPRPAYILYRPGLSMLHMWYRVFPAGSWTVGTYTPGAGVCSMYYGVTCGPWYTMGLITRIGTSLY